MNPERRYHLIAVNEKTGKKTYVSDVKNPMTHSEAVIVKSKFTVHKCRRIELENSVFLRVALKNKATWNDVSFSN